MIQSMHDPTAPPILAFLLLSVILGLAIGRMGRNCTTLFGGKRGDARVCAAAALILTLGFLVLIYGFVVGSVGFFQFFALFSPMILTAPTFSFILAKRYGH